MRDSPIQLPPDPYNIILEGSLYQGDYQSPQLIRPGMHIACAEEHPPDTRRARRTIFLPLDDDPDVNWSKRQQWLSRVTRVAQLAAREILNGGPVLTTCHMGLNRSGLLSALTLVELGFGSNDAIEMIRDARGPNALCNSQFVNVIRKVGREQ